LLLLRQDASFVVIDEAVTPQVMGGNLAPARGATTFLPIRINLTNNSSPFVGARAVEWGRVGLRLRLISLGRHYISPIKTRWTEY
jgi:hypothetical protein